MHRSILHIHGLILAEVAPLAIALVRPIPVPRVVGLSLFVATRLNILATVAQDDRLRRRMAAALLLHLEAVRKFAASMGVHRGKDEVLGSQFTHIRELLQSMTLTLDEAEKVVTAIGAVPWQGAKSEELMALVSQRVSKAIPVGKSKLQDYTALGSYFSECQWQQLLQEGPAEPKLELIITQASNLGLRFPNERTVQYIT